MDKIFKKCNKAGIIYVMDEAIKNGFDYSNREWANLGQGAAEAGGLKGASRDIKNLKINSVSKGYAPISGIKELRENVALLYNDLFRQDKKTKYKFNNVSIAGGGRLAISRVFTAINKKVKVGYFNPDYPGYEGILESFNNVEPVSINLKENNGFKISLEQIKKEVTKQKIDILLFSNPSNPTGNVIYGDELKEIISFARENKILLIIDEFYFNYVYNDLDFVSASEYIKDIEKDNIIIISGITKSWRFAGSRIAWILAPSNLIELFSSIGSFLDGGASRPMQELAIKLVNKKNLLKESQAIQKSFKAKRDYLKKELEEMGFVIKNNPEGSFYIWASLENLPKQINNDMKFFEKVLQEKVIVVPGRFFNINPYCRKEKLEYENYIRFSYGPDMKTIKRGVSAMKKALGLK